MKVWGVSAVDLMGQADPPPLGTMMKRLIALPRVIALLLLAGLTVDAQTVPSAYMLSWIPALEMTDGTPFDESAIEHYPLYRDGAFVVNIPNDFTRQFYIDVGLLGAGDHTCGISEVVDGIESVMSDTVTFPLGRRTPGRPSGLSVQGV